ncbi:MAG TPA: tetratricopeptide repeat protein [Chthoniobacter sp.]|nr:tetratricopeptide repeat protein [Chthoniobacter sp.]
MANSGPDPASYILACLLFIGGPIAGIIANSIALGRRATNRRCTLGMLLVLCGWVLAITSGMLARGGYMVPLLALGISLLVTLFTIAGWVFGIIGLVQCARNPQRYDRGRRRAIFALLLGGFLFALIGWGFYSSMQARNAMLTPLPPSPPTTSPKVTIGNLTLGASQLPASPSNAIANETWNFRIEPPPSWNAVSPTPFGPIARAAAVRSGPEMYSMVLAEHLPDAGQLAPQGAMELIKTSLKGRGNPEFLAEREFNVGSMRGWWMESRSHTTVGEVYYVHWVTCNNGTLYHMVIWAKPAWADRLRGESQQLVSGFHLINPNRNTLAPSEFAPTTFTSERFVYSVDLRNTGWTRRFTNLAASMPAAEFGATNATATACFIVIPVWIGEEPVDLSSLTHALTMRFGIPYPDEAISGEKDWTQNLLHGRAFAYESQREGVDFTYRLRVLQGRGFAYLLVAWMDKKSSPLTDQLDEALDRVTFPDQGGPQPQLSNDRERETQTLVYNSIGLALDRSEQTEAAKPWFKRGFEVTRHNPVLLSNYAEICMKLSQPAEALALLNEAMPNFPGNQKLASCRAAAQWQSGDLDGAIQSYTELFNTGWRNDVEFTGYIRELCNRSRADAALTALDRYTSGHDSAAMRRLRAEVLVAKGDPTQAIEMLTAAREKSPNDMEAALALVDTYLGARKLTEALAECDRLIATHHESVEVLRRKGLAEFALKHYREAKATLEKALAKAPTNLELQRLVEGVSGLLGEGRNTLVKTPIEPVKIPDALLQPEDADPADEYLRGYSAWYRCAVKVVSYHKGKELKTTEHQVIQIRDQQGVEKFSTLEFPYDPLGEEIFVNEVTVKDAAGKVLSRGKVEDSYVVDDGVDKAASQAKMLNVPVPGLQPGNTLEYTVTRRETGPAKAFTFQSWALLKGLPVLRSTLQIQAAHEDIRWEATPGVPAPLKEDGKITWSLKRPAVYRWEPLQAPLETFVPMVWISDANASWAGEAKEYLTQIKERLTVDAPVRDAAQELTKGMNTPAEKIAAITRFVQRGLTYKAIEFGRRARMPNPSVQTLRNKYGDCKDHALLLSQLLESAGIPARMALVRSTGALQAALPSLDQFDHAITYVPGEKGGTFIDATSKSGDFRSAPPLALAGQQALVLDPKGAHLQAIPPMPVDGSTVTTHRQVSFSNESDLKVDEEVVFTGTPAAGMRALFLALEPPQRVTYLQRMIAGEVPSISLGEAKFDELDNPHTPLHLHLHYTLAGGFHPAGSQLTGQVPAIWERFYVSGDAIGNRFSPFKVWDSTRIASTVEFTPPSGWHTAVGKGSSVKTPYCEALLKTSEEHELLRFESQLTQRAGLFPADQYSAYVEAVRKSRTLAEQSIVLERKK